MIILESSMKSDCKLVDTNNSLTALAQSSKGLKSTKVSPKYPDGYLYLLHRLYFLPSILWQIRIVHYCRKEL